MDGERCRGSQGIWSASPFGAPPPSRNIPQSYKGVAPLTMAQGGQVLVTLNLPAGSYALLGRVEIGQSSYSDNEFVGICDLTAGSDSDHVILQGTGTTSVGSTFEIRMATMSVLHTFPSPGSATISCGTTVPAPASGGNARITAVQVPGRACLRERHAVGGPRLGVVDRAQSNPALKVPI